MNDQLTPLQLHEARKDRMRERFARHRLDFIGLARELGESDPESYVDLSYRTSLAERCNEERTLDPVTGQWLTGVELIRLTGLGEEFSRRRGYTEAERAEHAECVRRVEALLARPDADEDAIQWLDGVISCQLDYGPDMPA